MEGGLSVEKIDMSRTAPDGLHEVILKQASDNAYCKIVEPIKIWSASTVSFIWDLKWKLGSHAYGGAGWNLQTNLKKK